MDAIREVLPLIVPQPAELVAARLSNDRVVAFYLDRAATARPAVFGAAAKDDMPCRLLRDVIDAAWNLVLRQPEFRDDVAFDILRELLTGQDELREGQRALLEGEATQSAKLDAIEEAAERRHRELLEAISREKGVPLAVLQQILAGFGDTEALLEPAQIEQRLLAKADEYRDLRARLERLTNDEPRVQQRRREAGELIGAGNFDAADAMLAEAERIDLDAAEELESLAERRRLSAAESRAERGAAARLRLAYRDAAEHYAAAADIVPRHDSATRWRYVLAQASALYQQGEEFGDNAALRNAHAAYQSALVLAPRERVPLDWAATQNNLGSALQRLGERESGTARLEQAVEAYRAALEERTRERVPLNWATTQNNLGNALRTLGARESGTARLEQAVSAFRAALEEYTRERAPLNWAMTQNNLGTALAALGERESGSARLEQSVAAFRAALEEYTRERVPLNWAATQNNLGTALAALGERESGMARLEQAVEAYRAALEERTRERVKLDWASSQHNLANALAALATRLRDPVRMAEALGCMRGAAEVFREGGNTYALPIAERRIEEIEAQLAAMRR